MYKCTCYVCLHFRYEVLGGGSQRLVLGLFSVSPATGVVTPGQSQTITVDCMAEKQNKHEEVLSMSLVP